MPIVPLIAILLLHSCYEIATYDTWSVNVVLYVVVSKTDAVLHNVKQVTLTTY